MNYKKRNKFDPNWVNSIMAGYSNGERYLASVNLHGLFIKSNYCLAGFASYFCNPIIKNNWNENMTE